MATPDEQAKTMIRNLPTKTGKSLQQWLAVLGDTPLEKHGEILRYLKTECGMTHGFANLVSAEFRNARAGGPASGEDLLDKQYSGPKGGLRPIYDAIVTAVRDYGSDVEVAPKKTYVSLRRNKQFALIQPSTRDRVDVGINLKDQPATGRLEAAGSFNAMVSHRVRLTAVADVDAQLEQWLRLAYDAS